MTQRWSEAGFQQTIALAEGDRAYRQALAAVKEKEQAYLRVLGQMSPAERDAIEAYIAACEALEDAFAYLAYEAGRRESHGASGPD